MTGESGSAAPDPGEVALYALTVWNYKQGEAVSLMIHLGDHPRFEVHDFADPANLYYELRP